MLYDYEVGSRVASGAAAVRWLTSDSITTPILVAEGGSNGKRNRISAF